MTDNTDFDEILDHVGGWGIFQKKLTGILMLATFVLSYVSHSPILYMYTPDHWCNIPQNYSDLLQISNQTDLEEIMIPTDKVTLKKSQCFMYDPNSIDDAISANRSQWQTTKCIHGWQYNFTGYYTSISTKVRLSLMLLYCVVVHHWYKCLDGPIFQDSEGTIAKVNPNIYTRSV